MTRPRHALLTRVHPDLYEQIARYAALSQRSLSAAATMLLERGLAAPDTARELEIHVREASH